MSEQTAVLIFLISILGIGAGLMFESAKVDYANRIPVAIHELRSRIALKDAYSWNITITRRSGYVSSVRTISGQKIAALDFAVGKLQQARIHMVEIVTNESHKFEVRAFYESAGHRRTGKYVGGFFIAPAQ